MVAYRLTFISYTFFFSSFFSSSFPFLHIIIGTASQAAIAGSALAQKAEAESDEVWLGDYAEPAAGTVGQWATSTSTSAGGADNSSGGEDENEVRVKEEEESHLQRVACPPAFHASCCSVG